MKQLFNQDDMLDRQIVRIENWGGDLFIFFHDNTFIWMKGGAEYVGDMYGVDFIGIHQQPICMDYKYSLNLIDEKEYDQWCNEKEEEESEQYRQNKIDKLKRLAEELEIELPNM